MQICSTGTCSAASALEHGASMRVAVKVQNQQEAEGRAAVGLIDSAGQVAPAPPRGVEPGKGVHIDVRV